MDGVPAVSVIALGGVGHHRAFHDAGRGPARDVEIMTMQERIDLLMPSSDPGLTIERYNFSLLQRIKLGRSKRAVLYRPMSREIRDFRPLHFITNAPCLGFVLIEAIYIGADQVLGPVDAFAFHPTCHGERLRWPVVTPWAQIRAVILYTGQIPGWDRGWLPGMRYDFCLSFQADAMTWAEMALDGRRATL